MPEYYQFLELSRKQDFGKLHQAIAAKSSVSNADRFYQPEWPNLRSLALTTKLFSHAELPQRINELLQAAASAAKKMPKLQTMDIWNCGEEKSVFRYRRCATNGCPVITFRSTGNLDLDIDQRTVRA
ncbi:hypothetical protein B7463_g7515, partial [Scytalidium lignicola]